MDAGRLRVLLNASALPVRPAGAGIYALELGRALAARDDVDLTVAAPSEPGFGSWLASPAAGPSRRLAWEQTGLRRAVGQAEFDVYHGTHMSLPLRARVPTVVTVHDLTFCRIPRRYDRRRRWYYRTLSLVAKRAQRIIVPSRAVAGDVVRYLSYPPERVRYVPEAPRAGLRPASPGEVGELCARLGIDRPYFVCLGTHEPGKRAVDALRAMRDIPGASLVLAGPHGPLTGALIHEAGRFGLEERVTIPGYVDDADLGPLLTGATALIFPSLYEGFGLPPLEAMACGTPVITTDVPAMNEILDDAAIFVPLRDPTAIAREATRLLREEQYRAEVAGKGLELAAGFSWERAAAETVEVYREVAA